MPGRKGVLAPQNSFLDTIATRFDGTRSCFLLGSAQVPGLYPIIYCSDGFCELTGHGRAQVMQKSCTCDFLYGKDTSQENQHRILSALSEQTRFQNVIVLYKIDGSKYDCLLDIVPIKNQNSEVVMFLVSLKDITEKQRVISPSEQKDEDGEASKLLQGQDGVIHKLSDSSITSLSESHEGFCMTGPRRRSRAVLYNLSGHIKHQSRINSCSSLTNMLHGGMHQPLEYKIELDRRNPLTIRHYALAKHVWDWLIVLLTLYVAAIVPYYASLQTLHPRRIENATSQGADHEHTHYPTYNFDMFLEFVFIADIFLGFRTTFVNKKGQIVSDTKEIASHYVRSMFIIDFIAAVPFDFIGHVFGINWSLAQVPVQLLKMVRLLRVLKLFKKMDHWSQHRVVVVFLLMFVFAMVAHWMACIWFSIGWSEYGESPLGATDGTGWIYELGRALHVPFYPNKTGGPEISSAYLTSLYFTLSSLTSVGFGNVSANTNAEKTFSICVMVVGAIMHAVVFGSITAIIQRMYKKRSDYDTKERNLKDFIKAHRIPKHLKKKLMENFHAKWSMNKGVDFKKVMEYFPQNIQADITMHLHQDLLQLPVFRNTSEGCRRFASLHANRRYASANEFLLYAGDALDQVFLVCSGSLEVLRNDIVIAILSKGDLFGADVSNDVVVTSRADVKTLTSCELQCVSVQGLKKLQALYPEHSNILDDMRADYSCHLWGQSVLDDSEFKRRRSVKIEEWNRHYTRSAEEEEASEESDSSCTYIPAITVTTLPTPSRAEASRVASPVQSVVDEAAAAIESVSDDISISHAELAEVLCGSQVSISEQTAVEERTNDAKCHNLSPDLARADGTEMDAGDAAETDQPEAHTENDTINALQSRGIVKTRRRAVSDTEGMRSHIPLSQRKASCWTIGRNHKRRVYFEDELHLGRKSSKREYKQLKRRGNRRFSLCIDERALPATIKRRGSKISRSQSLGGPANILLTPCIEKCPFTMPDSVFGDESKPFLQEKPSSPDEKIQTTKPSISTEDMRMTPSTNSESSKESSVSTLAPTPIASPKPTLKRQRNFALEWRQAAHAVGKAASQSPILCQNSIAVSSEDAVRKATVAKDNKEDNSDQSCARGSSIAGSGSGSKPESFTIQKEDEPTTRRNSRRRRRKKAETNRLLLIACDSSSDDKEESESKNQKLPPRGNTKRSSLGRNRKGGSKSDLQEIVCEKMGREDTSMNSMPLTAKETKQSEMVSPQNKDRDREMNCAAYTELQSGQSDPRDAGGHTPNYSVRSLSETYLPTRNPQIENCLQSVNSFPSVLAQSCTNTLQIPALPPGRRLDTAPPWRSVPECWLAPPNRLATFTDQHLLRPAGLQPPPVPPNRRDNLEPYMEVSVGRVEFGATGPHSSPISMPALNASTEKRPYYQTPYIDVGAPPLDIRPATMTAIYTPRYGRSTENASFANHVPARKANASCQTSPRTKRNAYATPFGYFTYSEGMGFVTADDNRHMRHSVAPTAQNFQRVKNDGLRSQPIPQLIVSDCDRSSPTVVQPPMPGTSANTEVRQSGNFLSIPTKGTSFESGYSTASPSYELNHL